MDERILHYDSNPPRGLHRKYFRMIFVAGIAAALWFWGPPIWRQANMLYWQYECLHYQAPPSQPIFIRLFDLSTPAYCADNPIQHLVSVPYATSKWRPTLFLHEIKGADGSPLLGTVFFEIDFDSNGAMHLVCYGEEYYPGSIWGKPKFKWTGDAGDIHLETSAPLKSLKVFPALIDAGNPNHFTFIYQLDGISHTADGWIDANGQFLISARPVVTATLPSSRE